MSVVQARLRAVSVGVVLTGSLIAAPGTAQAAEVLDQQSLTSSHTAAVHSGQSVAQTFTAGLTGGLSRVELQLDKTVASTTVPLFVELRNVLAEGGAPGPTVLATAQVAAATLPVWTDSPAPFLSVPFLNAPAVVAGTKYALLIHNNDVAESFNVGESSGGPYAGGSRYLGTSPPSNAWSVRTDLDVAFKTFVTPPAPAAPALDPACSFRVAAKNFNVISGTNGNDVLRGTSGRDLIFGYGGNDVIEGRGGNDVLCGGLGADAISGGRGDDRVSGGPGNDRIFGNRGDDILWGNRGRDLIRGGFGDDSVNGGPARDDVRS